MSDLRITLRVQQLLIDLLDKTGFDVIVDGQWTLILEKQDFRAVIDCDNCDDNPDDDVLFMTSPGEVSVMYFKSEYYMLVNELQRRYFAHRKALIDAMFTRRREEGTI